MRILVVGGTRFVGRHIVQAALDAGHEVTIFHRGHTNPALFPQVEHRLGDRDTDRSALTRGEWDATIDTCAYVPRQVRELAATLAGRGGRYVFVSTVSVYADQPGPGATEDAALQAPPPGDVEEVTPGTYGALKVACERATSEVFDDVTIVRPTYVVGPHDHTGRFPWWALRLARGGRVLAPGPADGPVQWIDGRDVGAFIERLVAADRNGTFHVATPSGGATFRELLQACAAVAAPPGTELVWADADFLADAGATDRMPLWPGPGPDRHLMTVDTARAQEAGLRTRPLEQTVRDTLAWATAADAPSLPAVGLDPETEARLLTTWDARQPS